VTILNKIYLSPFLYCAIFLLPLSVIVGYNLGGWYNFATLIMVFGVITVLDILFGVNTRNPDESQESLLADRIEYRLIPWLCAPVQIGMVAWASFVVTHRQLTIVELAGFVLSVGVVSGVLGINVSHELIHRVNNKVEPFLGRLMLSTVFYTHWAIEHVIGHHRRVATSDDPATARFGQSVYSFLPQTVLGGLRSAWQIESARLRKRDTRVWGFSNRVLIYMLVQFCLVILLGVTFGTGAVVFFFAQACIAVVLLETVNYLEHYGLVRRRLSNGDYEPVTLYHSWNASNWLTNYFLFNLQRHSDHHAKPGRRYQLLRHFDESPQLPTGYAGMVLLALVPSLWRRVMDRRVLEYVETRGHQQISSRG
jgi:alkane 1-monooxygenase